MTGTKVANKGKVKKKNQEQLFLSQGVVQAKRVKAKKPKSAKIFKVQYDNSPGQPVTSTKHASNGQTQVNHDQLKQLAHLCKLLNDKLTLLGQQTVDLNKWVEEYKKGPENQSQEQGPKIAKLPSKEQAEEPSFLDTIEGILEFITRPEVGNMVSEVVNGFAKG